MKIRLPVLPAIMMFIFFASCAGPESAGSADGLISADKSFSKLSEEKGMKQAFLEYAAENVVMLRKNKLLMKGKAALAEHFMTFSDTGFVLTWEPVFAEIAGSGDLGYTYGIYTSVSQNPDGSKKESKGTYVSIWKKDTSGSWKFVLDSGNEGTGEQL
jgi:ketosteroid isomerase-like protein